MPCPECGEGEPRTGLTGVPVQVSSAVIIVAGVPSDICDTCGRFFLDETTSTHLLRLAQSALNRGESTIDYQAEADE